MGNAGRSSDGLPGWTQTIHRGLRSGPAATVWCDLSFRLDAADRHSCQGGLLDYLRSGTGSSPLLMEVSERARVLVQRQGATLVTSLVGHGTLNVDVARIEQAVMILVDNAAKYSPPGGTVRLVSSSWNQELTIEVSDEGPGMREEDIPRIFERFHRIDKVRNRRLGGSGLGLAIAKTIIDAHHGRIEVQSRLGEGTKMRIQLPLAAPSVAGSITEAPRRLTLVS